MKSNAGAFEHGSRGKYQENKIIMIYALAGPPVGGAITHVIYWFSTFLESRLPGGSLIETVFTLIGSLPAFLLLSYPFGGVQALLVGLVIKTFARSAGGFGYLTAVFAAGAVGTALGVLLSMGYISALGETPVGVSTFLAVVGIFASIVVRFLFRDRFAHSNSSTDEA